MSIKCGKCGKINENVEGKCSECGEFLYQFFVQEQKKKSQKKLFSRSLWVVAGFILIALSIFGINKIYNNPLKSDLKKYLVQLKNADDYIRNSSATKDVLRIVYGESEDGKSLQKKKYSTLDKAKAWFSLFSLNYNTYLKITPMNQSIYELHNMILEGHKLSMEAQDSFIRGIQLGYITNVTETKDDSLTWNYSRVHPEYSGNYKNFNKKSEELYNEYKRKLEQLCEANKLMGVYGKVYPVDANMKNKITNVGK